MNDDTYNSPAAAPVVLDEGDEPQDNPVTSSAGKIAEVIGSGDSAIGARTPLDFQAGEEDAWVKQTFDGRAGTRSGKGYLQPPTISGSGAGPAPVYTGEVGNALQRAMDATGVSLDMLRRIVKIESGGNAGASTGSYHGLFQLSNSEFQKYGGGDIYNANDNAMAGAKKILAESKQFEARYDRLPTAGEVYMIHQQGAAGAAAHWANPDRPAWQNMLSTGEGRQKGEGWAKAAIWGNVPNAMKGDGPGQFHSVDDISGLAFTQFWEGKVGNGPVLAMASPETQHAQKTDPSSLAGLKTAFGIPSSEPTVTPPAQVAAKQPAKPLSATI